MPDLVILNRSTLVTPAQLATWLPALQTQVTRDLVPIWGTPGTLSLGDPSADVSAGAWPIILKDDPDAPDDLGFHLYEDGRPEARIFVRPTIQVGDEVSSVISHEIIETLVDPYANRMAPDGRHVVEIADPVQETRYRIGSVLVSDFVTPSYFGFDQGTKNDFLAELTARCAALLPGGYLMEWNGQGWVSKFGRALDGSLSALAVARAAANGRSSWRAGRGARSATRRATTPAG